MFTKEVLLLLLLLLLLFGSGAVHAVLREATADEMTARSRRIVETARRSRERKAWGKGGYDEEPAETSKVCH